MENLECHLLEAQTLVENKVAELQEVRQECDKLEDAVAGTEWKFSEKDELCDIELCDALSSNNVHREHAERLRSELELMSAV